MSVYTPIDYAIPPKKDCARYKMHKYWAAKPWYVVAEYIKHFTREGDIVLDPFCGSGVVGCEALVHRRKTVLNDLNPIATFIAENTCRSPVELDKFVEEFKRIKAKVKDEIMSMYQLIEPCPVCGAKLYMKHLVRGPVQGDMWIVEARCSKGHGRSGNIRRPLLPEEKAQIKTIEDREIPYWFPTDEFPDGRETMRLKKAGMHGVHQLFTLRNLMALSIIYNEIQKTSDSNIRELLLMGFSNTLLHTSKLKSETLRPMSANSYYCMGDWIEENVWMRFENRVKWRWGVYEGKKETNSIIREYFKKAESFDELLLDKTFLMLNGAAQSLKVPDESIDYCFTDPPYGGSIQYFELTFLWRSWLKMCNDFSGDEITVNDYQGKQYEDFEQMLTLVFKEVYRVLKPERWLSITFNNRDQKIWLALLKACQRAGFEKVNVVPQKPIGNSFVQSWTGRSLKRDLILNFRKTANAYKSTRPCTTKSSFDAEDIILQSAYECLTEGKASLPEIFEIATIRWIDLVYGGLDSKELVSPDDEGTIYFDMKAVDFHMRQQPNFIRIEEKNAIYYRLEED